MDVKLGIQKCLKSLGIKTSSQVTANTGLMLVNTNGNDAGEPLGYITREVLLQMIRDELSSVLSNLSGTATQVLGKTANGGIGFETIQNLASVLGGAGSMRALENHDADTLTTPGFYQSSAWSNTPQNSGILIMPYYLDGFWKFQIFCDNSSQHIWFRSGSSAAYSPWNQIK